MNFPELAGQLGAQINTSCLALTPNRRITPFGRALVFASGASEMEITAMQFSLHPRWAKEPRLKFSTYNARIETAAEKPTWREPLKGNHCLIPMTAFFEACYQGLMAGNMARVSGSQDFAPLLLAAGIYDTWKNPLDNSTLTSFAILTQAAEAQLLEAGHDRQPIFLDQQTSREWANRKFKSSTEAAAFLNTTCLHPKFDISVDRPLKVGWEKRKK